MQNFFKKYGYGILLGLIILLGVLLRLKGFLANPSFWHDECALAWNVKYKTFGDFFGILRFMQMAPPFFMIATKIIANIFGVSEITLRILPFLVGGASILAFYFLAKKTMKSNAVALWAVFFFAINQRLINYSFEFKPYSFDVLFAIILLLFFMNFNLEKLNAKKALFYGILLAVVPWFSFTSLFIIAGGSINLLFKILKNNSKNYHLPFTIYHLPLILSVLIYIKLYMINNYTGTHMVNYWQDSFLSFNPVAFLSQLVDSLRYFFFPMPFVLFGFILFLWGVGIFYKEKSEFFKISFLSFMLLIVASLLHLYPFGTRLILFLLPIFLLCMMKPVDLALEGKKTKIVGVFLFIFFAFYPQIISINMYIHSKNISRGEYPREIMDYMIKNLKKDDNVFVNSASDVEFYYYSSFYDIKNNVIQERVTNDGKEKYVAFLKGLKSGNYWFYLPYDSSHTPVFAQILDWVKTQKILFSTQKDKSVLMYVRVG